MWISDLLIGQYYWVTRHTHLTNQGHTWEVSMLSFISFTDDDPSLSLWPSPLPDERSLDFFRGACIWRVLFCWWCTVILNDLTSSCIADKTVTTVHKAFWFSDITSLMWSILSRDFSSSLVLVWMCCSLTSSNFRDLCMASSWGMESSCTCGGPDPTDGRLPVRAGRRLLPPPPPGLRDILRLIRPSLPGGAGGTKLLP